MVNKSFTQSAYDNKTAAWMNERVLFKGQFMVRSCAFDIAAACENPERQTQIVCRLPEWSLHVGDAVNALIRAVTRPNPAHLMLAGPPTIDDPDYPVTASQLA